jgi:hypothetical protein
MPYYDNENNDSNSLNSTDRLAELNRQLQLSDKYFQRLKRNKLDEKTTMRRNDGTNYYKNVYVNVYGTGGHGNFIRNAVTGVKYTHKVGSKGQQTMFYIVGVCSGENGMSDTLTLYFDTPEQYESHMGATLDPYQKTEWHLNKAKMMEAY